MDEPILNAILRSDFYAFVQKVFAEVAPGDTFEHGWHIQAMGEALGKVARGDCRRLIIEIPPRSLKSICASVAFPAWLLGHSPTRKILCVSYSQDLASIHAAQCRQVIQSAWYRSLFPGTAISPLKNTEAYFKTTRGGYRDATSIGGTLTGKGGDLIIIDDPLKPEDAMSEAARESVKRWYDQTLLSRLNSKKRDAIMLVMQRLHFDDLAGHVRNRGDWATLSLPAIATKGVIIDLGGGRSYHRRGGELLAPAREPQEVLDELKAAMGARAFSAQYQQNPLPDDGGLVDWNWFKRWKELPPRGHFVQSWDCASKNTEFADYSVCTTWLVFGDQYWLVDIFRAKLSYPELRRAVVAQSIKWGANELLIEDAAAGIALIQEMKLNRPCKTPLPVAVRPERDKITRLHTVSAIIEQGRVYIPEQAAWLDELRREILQFPTGRYDDQVDSISQFLHRMERRRLRRSGIEAIPMFRFGSVRHGR